MEIILDGLLKYLFLDLNINIAIFLNNTVKESLTNLLEKGSEETAINIRTKIEYLQNFRPFSILSFVYTSFDRP